MRMWELMVDVASILATPVLVVSYLPQIVSLIKTKNAEGISMSFWFILDLSLLFLFVLSLDSFINTGETSLLIAQSANLLVAMINTILVVYYKKKARKPKSLLGLSGEIK